jgi:hypothetical protein
MTEQTNAADALMRANLRVAERRGVAMISTHRVADLLAELDRQGWELRPSDGGAGSSNAPDRSGESVDRAFVGASATDPPAENVTPSSVGIPDEAVEALVDHSGMDREWARQAVTAVLPYLEAAPRRPINCDNCPDRADLVSENRKLRDGFEQYVPPDDVEAAIRAEERKLAQAQLQAADWLAAAVEDQGAANSGETVAALAAYEQARGQA